MPMTDREVAQLAALLGGPMVGGVVGGAMAPEGERMRRGLGTFGGGYVGGMGGALGGAALGGLAGGALGGLADVVRPRGMFDDEPTGMLTGAGLGAALGGLGGALYGTHEGAGAGYDFMQPQEKRSHDMNYQTKLAFAYGACEKLASVGVHPADFVQAAAQSNDPDAIKIAEAILELDQFEKTARVDVGELAGKARNVGRRMLGKTELDVPAPTVNIQRAGAEAAPTPQEASAMMDAAFDSPVPTPSEFSRWMNANMAGGGAQPGGTQAMFGGAAAPSMRAGAGDLSRAQLPHDLPTAINVPFAARYQDQLRYAPHAAAGLAGAAGLGGAVGYGMGPADTLGNQLRGYANMLPGVDMPMQSRLSALLGG